MSVLRTLLALALGLFVMSCTGSGAKPGGSDGGPDAPIQTGDGAIDHSNDGGGDAGGDGTGSVREPLGTPCLLATECASGFCVDSVCCDTGCTDVCQTCALQGAVGTCKLADLGTDPRNEC